MPRRDERARLRPPQARCRGGLPAPRVAGGGGRAATRAAGFTLVELLVAVATAFLLGAMALPSFRDWLAAYQLANYAKDLAETMTRARTEAVRRGHRVGLCRSLDRSRCAADAGWDAGFVVFGDVNGDGQRDDDEPVLGLGAPAPPGISVQANRPVADYVSYTSVGHARMLNGALQMGTFTVCRSGHPALAVVLAGSGRVRIDRTASRCP